jgi:hypothetical protein
MQIERATSSVFGMYGDLQGIAGSSLPAVEGLALPELDDQSDKPKLSVVNSDMPPAADADEEK